VAAALAIEDRPGDLLAVTFTAMASPCEVLFNGAARARALDLGTLAAQEAWRIEHKYSRYRDDSVVADIHRNRGRRHTLDAETASLLQFAQQCFEMSDGLFDITSGILRNAWKFDGSDRIPDKDSVAALLPRIGFGKLQWDPPDLLLPPGMELDFGGIGKEYAVDTAYEILAARCSTPFLVNFGGDLRANQPPSQGVWRIGVERPDTEHVAAMLLELEHGALATSGDSHRFLLKDSVRYSHILDPRTGWPVIHAPRSVTVAASSCIEAGLLATLSMLRGGDAERFLQGEGVRYWIVE
jgi:thiamine biosynthesis lipoprotein